MKLNLASRVCGLVVIVSLAVIPSTVWAESDGEQQEVDEEQSGEQQAVEYYQEARQAYADGHFERAAELLDRAYEHDSNLIYRYNQILAYQGLGDYDRALELLDEYEEAMRADDDFDDIGEIRSEVQAARVEVDEHDDSADPHEIAMPGPEVDESSRTLGWTITGTGVAVLSAGVVVGSGVLIGDEIERLENSKTATGHHQIYGDSSYERDDDLDTLRTHQIVAAALVSGGVVLAATGSLVLWRSGDSEAPAANSSLRLEPVVDTERAGAALTGRF